MKIHDMPTGAGLGLGGILLVPTSDRQHDSYLVHTHTEEPRHFVYKNRDVCSHLLNQYTLYYKQLYPCQKREGSVFVIYFYLLATLLRSSCSSSLLVNYFITC